MIAFTEPLFLVSFCLFLFLHNISNHSQCVSAVTVFLSALHDNSIKDDKRPHASTDPFLNFPMKFH